MLKKLGGDLPPEVKKLMDSDLKKREHSSDYFEQLEKKNVTGFSLVAGYGEDSDEEQEDEEEMKDLFQNSSSVPVKNPMSHSTLFPITEPIDVTQFDSPKVTEKSPEENKVDVIDVKAFQRKRRIGVDLINTRVRCKEKKDEEESCTYSGVAFKPGGVQYPGFKSGGVMFVKSDVLNPVAPRNIEGCKEKAEDDVKSGEFKKSEYEISEERNVEIKKGNIIEGKNGVEDENELDEMQNMLGEKLNFLNEGREPATAVQIMIIQLEVCFFLSVFLYLIFIINPLTDFKYSNESWFSR